MTTVGPIRKNEAARFGALDAMRGVAAIMVVLYHTGQAGLGRLEPPFGYLAVDLFFVLSGFVIAHSYDHRFAAGMSVSSFMRRRTVRLFPLYLLGFLLGLATGPVVLTNYAPLTGSTGTPSMSLLAMTAAANFVLLPGFVPILFPFNHAMWSLFFEFWVANFSYAVFWRRLTSPVVATIVMISAAGLTYTEKVFHGLSVGWNWALVGPGIFRVVFSFYAGVLLARLHARRPPKLRAPAWFIVLIAGLSLAVPLDGGVGRKFELGCVLFLFPALVRWGARAKERDPKIGQALGDASYALYACHWPIMVWFVGWYLPKATRVELPPQSSGLQITLTTALALAAFAIHHVADEPFRRWLSRLLTPGRRPVD